MQNYEDVTLECVDCGARFVWKAGERRFFANKGLRDPKRCPACRQHRRETIEKEEPERWTEKSSY